MADSQRDKSLVGSNPYGTIHYEILHLGENALIPTLLLLLMVSPLPLMCFLLVCVRVSAGQRALLPHIPRVTGDGQLVNLSLK